MPFFRKKSILYQNMCYNDIIFGGALMSPEISKKYLRIHFF